MKNGKYDEGEATLRMKITLEEGKQVRMTYVFLIGSALRHFALITIANNFPSNYTKLSLTYKMTNNTYLLFWLDKKR